MLGESIGVGEMMIRKIVKQIMGESVIVKEDSEVIEVEMIGKKKKGNKGGIIVGIGIDNGLMSIVEGLNERKVIEKKIEGNVDGEELRRIDLKMVERGVEGIGRKD